MMHGWRVAALGLALAFGLLLTPVDSAGQDSGTVVWLVRHAERADQGTPAAATMAPQTDPELSSVGHQRAQTLASMLRDAGLTRIFSTPFARTRQTATPLATLLGLEVELYDPRQPETVDALLDDIGSRGGRYLIVGHSNTTPALVERLGGESHGAIAEDEYDRLYVIVRDQAGAVTSTLLRFSPVPEI
jgi:phosphohistidine phosphatase SixA